MPELVPLPGSEQRQLPNAKPSGELDANESITVTLVLRRRAELPQELIVGPVTLSAAELANRYGATPEDAELLTSALARYGLTVADTHLGSRRIKVSGKVGDLSRAFGTTVSQVTSPHPDTGEDVTHRYRTGGLSVPAELDGVVLGVHGLDTRPLARAQFRVAPDMAEHSRVAAPHKHKSKRPKQPTEPQPPAPRATPLPAQSPSGATPMTVPQVASLYDFPAGTDGTGQTIAVIELGGGYTASDLQTFFSGLSLAVPSVNAVPVDGGSNSPGQEADGEVELDIEVAGAVAPKATLQVYFAPNTDQGFIDAISDAVHATPTPTVVSISWGQSEDGWAGASRTSMDSAFQDAATLGVTVCVAAGDNGSTDSGTDGKQHCDYPASSPYTLGCGGTTLIGSGTTITSEVVWNETANNEGAGGGGVSDVYPLPSWQANAGVPNISGGTTSGRGVPDVAGNADPASGYQIVVDGQQTVIGGTSAVAPLWAGLIARLAQAMSKKFGLIQPVLYNGISAGNPVAGFNDITQGNNGAYSAGPGWDACTGLGSPNGTELLTRLKG